MATYQKLDIEARTAKSDIDFVRLKFPILVNKSNIQPLITSSGKIRILWN